MRRTLRRSLGPQWRPELVADVLDRRQAFDRREPDAPSAPQRRRCRNVDAVETVAELDDAAAPGSARRAAASSQPRQPMISAESLDLTDSHRPGVTDFIHVDLLAEDVDNTVRFLSLHSSFEFRAVAAAGAPTAWFEVVRSGGQYVRTLKPWLLIRR